MLLRLSIDGTDRRTDTGPLRRRLEAVGVSDSVWVVSGGAGLRLVSNTNSSSSVVREGRLEVYYNGQWGSVCDHAFSDVAATVACRALGFTDRQDTSSASAGHGERPP